MTTKGTPICTDVAPGQGVGSDKQETDEAAAIALPHEMPAMVSAYYLRGPQQARELPQPTA